MIFCNIIKIQLLNISFQVVDQSSKIEMVVKEGGGGRSEEGKEEEGREVEVIEEVGVEVIEGQEVGESRVIGGAEIMIEVEGEVKTMREGVKTVIEETGKVVREGESAVIEAEEVEIEAEKAVKEVERVATEVREAVIKAMTEEQGGGEIMKLVEAKGAEKMKKGKRHR